MAIDLWTKKGCVQTKRDDANERLWASCCDGIWLMTVIVKGEHSLYIRGMWVTVRLREKRGRLIVLIIPLISSSMHEPRSLWLLQLKRQSWFPCLLNLAHLGDLFYQTECDRDHIATDQKNLPDWITDSQTHPLNECLLL